MTGAQASKRKPQRHPLRGGRCHSTSSSCRRDRQKRLQAGTLGDSETCADYWRLLRSIAHHHAEFFARTHTQYDVSNLLSSSYHHHQEKSPFLSLPKKPDQAFRPPASTTRHPAVARRDSAVIFGTRMGMRLQSLTPSLLSLCLLLDSIFDHPSSVLIYRLLNIRTSRIDVLATIGDAIHHIGNW